MSFLNLQQNWASRGIFTPDSQGNGQPRLNVYTLWAEDTIGYVQQSQEVAVCCMVMTLRSSLLPLPNRDSYRRLNRAIPFLGTSSKISPDSSAIASSYFGGVMIGILFAHLFADVIGRKRSIQFGGCVGLVGAIIQTASFNVETFFVGRVFAGCASGIMLPVVNVYQAEIAPPHIRGAMVCTQLVLLASAGTLASIMGFACYHSSNESFAW